MADFVEGIVVFITAPPGEAAERVARKLLDEKLAACVNIVPGLRSLYWWEGKVQDDAEVLLIVKTRRSLFPALVDTVRSVHPYTTPEIIALPVVAGFQGYLDWVTASTARPAR